VGAVFNSNETGPDSLRQATQDGMLSTLDPSSNPTVGQAHISDSRIRSGEIGVNLPKL
jgi:hypothetical protein